MLYPPPASVVLSMSTSVVRYCPPPFPEVVSTYATPGPPSSKRSACTVPGSATGVPPYGVELELAAREPEPVVVAHPAVLRRPRVEHEPDHVGPGGERHPGLRDRLPHLPAARVRHAERARAIDAVDLDMEPGAGADVRDAHVERVGARACHGDRILQPLPRTGAPDVVAAAGVGRAVDIHVGGAVLPAAVARGGVDVCDARPALVEALGLHRAWERHCRAAVRRGAGACRPEPEPVVVAHAAVLRRARLEHEP